MGVPRPPRQEEPGAIHHVWARGNRTHLVFLDDLDYRRYVDLLRRVAERQRWRCLAVFKRPYGSKRLRDDGQLIAVIAYVVANPVEAALCSHPDEWPWGSHAAAPPWVDFDRLLELLGGWTQDPLRVYHAIVGDRVERYFGGSEAA